MPRNKRPPNLGILSGRLREFRLCALSKTRVTFISKRRTHFVIYCSPLLTFRLSLHADIVRASSRGMPDEPKERLRERLHIAKPTNFLLLLFFRYKMLCKKTWPNWVGMPKEGVKELFKVMHFMGGEQVAFSKLL